MTLMRIREIASCPQHKRTIIILEDVHQCLRLTFYADPDLEAGWLLALIPIARHMLAEPL